MNISFKNNSSLQSNTVVTQHSGRGLHSREDHSSEEEEDVVMSHSEVTFVGGTPLTDNLFTQIFENTIEKQIEKSTL